MQNISRPGDADYVVPGSPEYREHLGCSEVADILGWGYGTPDKLWRKKTHKAPQGEHKRIYDRGHAMEPHMTQRARELGRVVVAEQVQYRDPDRPFLIYHADAMFPKWTPLEPGDKPREGAGVGEWKAPGDNMAAQMAREGMTSGYVCQGQCGMHVAAAALGQPVLWGTFGYWDYNEWDLVAFDVAASPEFQAKMLAAIDEFWDCVVRDVPPKPLEEIEKVEPPAIKGEVEVITEGDLVELGLKWSELRSRVLDEALAREKELKDQMRALCEPYSKVEIPGIIKFSYTQSKDSVSYDGPGLVAYCEYLMTQIDEVDRRGISKVKPFTPSHFITVKPGSRSFRPTLIKE